jgi:hypothetical protein
VFKNLKHGVYGVQEPCLYGDKYRLLKSLSMVLSAQLVEL